MGRIFWLWIPLAFMAMQIVFEVTLDHTTLSEMHGENGLHEILQWLAISAALIVAISALLNRDIRADRPLAAWFGLAAICCFYVAGEEVSWGQHFMNWSTPEYWAALNDQQETNLHNVSSWLDQKPRLMLEIGIITGGLLIPLFRRLRPQWVPARFEKIYPPDLLVPVALLALLPKLAASIAEIWGVILFERVSEVEELYLFYFVLLYLICIKRKTVVRVASER